MPKRYTELTNTSAQYEALALHLLEMEIGWSIVIAFPQIHSLDEQYQLLATAFKAIGQDKRSVDISDRFKIERAPQTGEVIPITYEVIRLRD